MHPDVLHSLHQDRLTFTVFVGLVTLGLVLLMVTVGRPVAPPQAAPTPVAQDPGQWSRADTAVDAALDAEGQVILP